MKRFEIFDILHAVILKLIPEEAEIVCIGFQSLRLNDQVEEQEIDVGKV